MALPPLYRLLDAIREAERATPEATGLADLMWLYSQGVELSPAQLAKLDAIVVALHKRQGKVTLLVRQQAEPSISDTMWLDATLP